MNALLSDIIASEGKQVLHRLDFNTRLLAVGPARHRTRRHENASKGRDTYPRCATLWNLQPQQEAAI